MSLTFTYSNILYTGRGACSCMYTHKLCIVYVYLCVCVYVSWPPTPWHGGDTTYTCIHKSPDVDPSRGLGLALTHFTYIHT